MICMQCIDMPMKSRLNFCSFCLYSICFPCQILPVHLWGNDVEALTKFAYRLTSPHDGLTLTRVEVFHENSTVEENE